MFRLRSAVWLFWVLVVVPIAAQTDPGTRLRQIQDRAEAALQRGDSAAAIAALEEGLKLEPAWKEGLWTLGLTLFRERRYQAARPVFVSLLRLDQSKSAPWLLLGLCEFDARDYGMAFEDLQRGRSMGIPINLKIAGAVRYHLACTLTLAGKHEAALELLDEAARDGEHTNEILTATGLAALHLPMLPAQAAEAYPRERISMLRDVGEALYQGSRLNREETHRIYGRLLQQPAVPARLHYSYGYFLVGIGDLARAETEFRAELAADPQSALARCGLAHIALERDEPAAALDGAREAAQLSPDWGAAHFVLGKALLRSGKMAESIRELETARDLEPASRKIRFALSQAYRAANRPEDAEREAREVKRLKDIEAEWQVRGHLQEDLLPSGKSGEKPR